jgi:hypothetical protein
MVVRNRAVLWLAVVAAGCSNPQSKACHERMAQAQSFVSGVDGNSLESVERGIALIQSAETTCSAQGMTGEVSELRAARDRLASHRTLLVERDERKRGSNLTPEQLEKYVKSGDPNCPKGQAYSHKASKKEIRCVGLRPAEMTRALAEQYFKGKGFRPVQGKPASMLAMEAGAERYFFFYRDAAGGTPPYCLVLYPKPGIPWQEAVARFTGTTPEKIKLGGSVTVSSVALAIAVDERNVVVKLGDCPTPLP